MSTEQQEAIALANRVLDRINADPDDDLAVLARQLLRSTEAIPEWEGELTAEENAMIDAAWEKHKAAEPPKPVAVVINNNQPGRTTIIEVLKEPPTLDIGTELWDRPSEAYLKAQLAAKDAELERAQVCCDSYATENQQLHDRAEAEIRALDAACQNGFGQRDEALAQLAAATKRLEEAFRTGYRAGFDASADGWNAEYPFGDKGKDCTENEHWREVRDRALAAFLAPNPTPEDAA